MHFTKLRVSGFKSFVDPVELLIESGMTGVVGPNGCGKSNIIEALRWVMGETSAKSMRAGGMDDVIFGGTTTRPARNIAEVVLHLDNSARKAQGPFSDTDELEISRRIERDIGSTYRVNGKEVRARDVQLLFADMASGAHSTALVSQGRVAAMIGAKPTERRALLEEAAGIKGLHSRRHEAELRLRAAETNLERLEDVIGALEGQHQGLQRQARQAARYRRLSDQIRRFEAILLHHSWNTAKAGVDSARAALETVQTEVVDRTAAAAAAATVQAEAATTLPALRQADAEAAAAVQHLTLTRRELDAEAERINAARNELVQRLQQIAADIERERALEADATAALERLEEERQRLTDAQAGEAEAREQGRAVLDEVTQLLEEREAALQALIDQAAEAEARRESLSRRVTELGDRVTRLTLRRETLEAERAKHAEALEEDGDIAAAATALSHAEEEAEIARESLETAEAARAEAELHAAETREVAQNAETKRAGLAAEEQALATLLESGNGDTFAPVIDSVTVESGYETALGAALGDDLNAATAPNAPARWTRLPELSPAPLPGGISPLGRFVDAPPELARRLAAIGVVGSSDDGDRLAPALTPGQRLVSRDGGLWRWDGFTIVAGTPTAAATRLAQRNRLAEIRRTLEEANEQAAKARAGADDARAVQEQSQQRDREARQAMRDGFARVNAAREAHATLIGARNAAEVKLSSLTATLQATKTELEEAIAGRDAAQADLETLDDTPGCRDAMNAARTEVSELRAQQAERRSAHDRLTTEAERRGERLLAIEAEALSWRQRTEGTRSRLADLDGRREAGETESQRLAARPGEIGAQRSGLMDQLAEAEGKRSEAADKLTTAETGLIDADRRLKAAEAALAEARETKVRAEARLEQADHDRDGIAARIREKLDVAPERILEAGGIEPDEELPDAGSAAAKLERLVLERDGMGPVNLRAESEAEELREQVDSLQAEREDLLAAIARLRQGIGALNREGRERLMAAYTLVNEHFQELFTRLFGGGRAHLTLTETEDPLNAGLEIMASPPGKKLTSMSLLSGGEQALTAVALLFAVFLTNPAPICVLDEVDAPLDDSNVDRFCALVDDIARSGDTRFLVVTHHRMTMARMDRLFGVTMGEAGVSQLVSVDLRRAVALRESV